MQPAPIQSPLYEGDNLSPVWVNWFHKVAMLGYHDIGDPAAAHFDEEDLTTDATWNDLDLSSIVGKGIKLVHLYVAISDGAAGSVLGFRQNGNVNAWNAGFVRTQVADVYMDADIFVLTDASGIIEYYGSDLDFTTIDITVRGWSL